MRIRIRLTRLMILLRDPSLQSESDDFDHDLYTYGDSSDSDHEDNYDCEDYEDFHSWMYRAGGRAAWEVCQHSKLYFLF